MLPGPIVPDGNGGVLATWTGSPSHSVLPFPYQAADVTNYVVGTPYNLPFSPPSVTPFVSPTLVLGENGVAFASGTTTATVNGTPTQVSQIASFNVTSGAPNWTYQAAAGDTLSIVEATAGGGVTVNDSNTGVFSLNSSGTSNTNRQARRLPGTGTPAASSLPSGAVPFDLSTWLSAASGAVAALWSPNGSNGISTLLAQSAYPQSNGNSQRQSQPPFCHRKNNNCVLAPNTEWQSVNGPAVQRNVKYELFNLQGAYLNQVGSSAQSKIVLVEQNSTSSSAHICDWQTPAGRCFSPDPDPNDPDNHDSGFLTDHMSSGGGPSYSVNALFAVDRGQVQVFWPLKSNNYDTWYGAWDQTATDSANADTIVQDNPNFSNPVSCVTGCSPIQPNGTQ